MNTTNLDAHRERKAFDEKYETRYWKAKVTKADREEYYITTYPIFMHTTGVEMLSLKDSNAPRTLEQAEQIAEMAVKATEGMFKNVTYAIIYEMKAMTRIGTEHKRKAASGRKRAQRI